MLQRTKLKGGTWPSIAVITITLMAAVAWGHAFGSPLVWAQGPIPESITLPLNPVSDSNQTGHAIITAMDDGIEVKIELPPKDGNASGPAHIHFGRECPLAQELFKGLRPLNDKGESTTFLEDVSLERLLVNDFGINTHDVNSNASNSCGAILASTNDLPVFQGSNGGTGWLWAFGIISMILSIVAVSGFAFLYGRRSA